MTDARTEDQETWQEASQSPQPVEEAPAQVSPSQKGTASFLRIIWAGAMLVVLAVAWTLTSPGDRPSEQYWGGELKLAETAFEMDNSRAQGAPQQQVVNGWYLNDVAAIQADQLTAQHEQTVYLSEVTNRIAALLGVIALTVIGDVALRGLPVRKRTLVD